MPISLSGGIPSSRDILGMLSGPVAFFGEDPNTGNLVNEFSL